MEKIYAENENKCKLVKSNALTIRFLLDYSKSLNIMEAEGLQFESNLN